MQMWSLHRILSVLHKVTFSVLLAVQVVVAFWLLTRSVNIFALILFLVFLTLVGVAFFISLMERKKQSEPTPIQMHGCTCIHTIYLQLSSYPIRKLLSAIVIYCTIFVMLLNGDIKRGIGRAGKIDH